MNAEGNGTSFERWALLGALALAAVGFGAFLTRHGAAEGRSGDEADGARSELLTVRIGGPRSADGPGASTPDGPDGPEAPKVVVPDPPPGPGVQPPDAPPSAPRAVIVRPGETLGQIVQRELGSLERLDDVIRLNGISNPDSIRAGAEILLPTD